MKAADHATLGIAEDAGATAMVIYLLEVTATLSLQEFAAIGAVDSEQAVMAEGADKIVSGLQRAVVDVAMPVLV